MTQQQQEVAQSAASNSSQNPHPLGRMKASGEAGVAVAARTAPMDVPASAVADVVNPATEASAATTSPSSSSALRSPPPLPFSLLEQQRLEYGLATIRKTVPDRWEQIAELVGRSKAECVARFKQIQALIKAQRGQ
jgi:hypothetical protein